MIPREIGWLEQCTIHMTSNQINISHTQFGDSVYYLMDTPIVYMVHIWISIPWCQPRKREKIGGRFESLLQLTTPEVGYHALYFHDC